MPEYVDECPICGAVFTARRSDKRTCGRAACRKADYRLRAGAGLVPELPAEVEGAVAGAVDGWLAGVEVPGPLAAGLRVLAVQLDARPGSSPLWARYDALLGRALEEARRDEGDDAAFEALLREISNAR
jgi:hypothetical protein